VRNRNGNKERAQGTTKEEGQETKQPTETGLFETSRDMWTTTHLPRETQTAEGGVQGRRLEATPPQSGATGTHGRTPGPYTNPRKMKRDNTPLINKIYTRTYVVSGEFGTYITRVQTQLGTRVQGGAGSRGRRDVVRRKLPLERHQTDSQRHRDTVHGHERCSADARAVEIVEQATSQSLESTDR
jgi:hypothetical protein